ncbi:MAG: hypothetical protein U1E65_29495 [Myxococcota bacterium]
MNQGLVSALCISAFLTSFSASAVAADPNALEKRTLYTVTVEVGGKVLALTHVPAPDTPKNLLGTSPAKTRVELRPLQAGDPAQLWRFYPAEVVPEPSYKIFSKLSANDTTPNATLMITDVNGDFAADGNDSFHEKYNRVTTGLHQDANDRVWLVQKLPSGKFVLQSFLGVKAKLVEKGDSHGWDQERVLEAVGGADGAKLRQRPRAKAPGQEWTLTPAGNL